MRAALVPLVVFAVLVPACGDRTITEGLEQPLAVHGGQFVEGELPGAPPEAPLAAPRATAVTTERTNLRPRLAGIPFFGWATLDAVAVGARIEGQGSGYWVVPAGPPDPQVQGEPVRTWRFEADLNEALAPGKHRLLVAAIDADGRAGTQNAATICVNRPVPDNGNVCDPRKVPPELVVSLTWDRPVDLDLIVVTPNSEIIASRSPSKGLAPDGQVNRNVLDKNAPGVGYLDFDSNAGCHIDGLQSEHVVFQEKPAPGSYLVYVDLHDACHEETVRYVVSRTTRTLLDAQAKTFSVVETDRTAGSLVAIQANGESPLGTFVTELFVP